jgi:hypothetical protein
MVGHYEIYARQKLLGSQRVKIFCFHTEWRTRYGPSMTLLWFSYEEGKLNDHWSCNLGSWGPIVGNSAAVEPKSLLKQFSSSEIRLVRHWSKVIFGTLLHTVGTQVIVETYKTNQITVQHWSESIAGTHCCTTVTDNATICIMWHEEHPFNIIILQRVHLSNLVWQSIISVFTSNKSRNLN